MSNSEFFVDNPVMTRPGSAAEATAVVELVFTVFRTYFWEPRPVTVSYVVSGVTAVENTDYSAGSDALSGNLTFNQFDIWKPVKIRLLYNAAASGDLTLTCTITPASTHRSGSLTFDGETWSHVGTGKIQDGEIFYISSSGSSGNDGLSPSTAKDINSLDSLFVAPASGGQGRAILLEAGATFNLTTQLLIDGSRKGGTIGNPCILGRYGEGANPKITKGANYIGLAGDSSFVDGCAITWQDLDIVGSATYNANVIQSFNLSTYPVRNFSMLRTKVSHDVESYTPQNTSMANMQDIPDSRVMFCEFTGGGEIGYFGDSLDEKFIFVGNKLHDNVNAANPDPARDWSLYIGTNNPLLCWNNYFFNEYQGIKLRSVPTSADGQRSKVMQNYVDLRGGIGNLAMAIDADSSSTEFVNGSLEVPYTAPTYLFVPFTNVDIEKNIIFSTPLGVCLWISDADGYDFNYDPASFGFDSVNIRNNIFIHEGTAQSALVNLQQNNRDLKAYNNTFIRLSDLTTFNYAAYPTNFVEADRGDDDPSYFTQDYAQGFVWKNNLILSLVASPTNAVNFFTYGTSANTPYNEGANPNVYVDKDNNHYSMNGGGNVYTYNGTSYTLSQFVAQFTSGGEGNSVEADAKFTVGNFQYCYIPTAPVAADPTVAPTDDFFGNVRGTDTCCGAIHVPVANPAGVRMGT